MENIITPKYWVEVVDTNGDVVNTCDEFCRYVDAKNFVDTSKALNDGEHYRIIRTDYIEDEELVTECVYEQM